MPFLHIPSLEQRHASKRLPVRTSSHRQKEPERPTWTNKNMPWSAITQAWKTNTGHFLVMQGHGLVGEVCNSFSGPLCSPLPHLITTSTNCWLGSVALRLGLVRLHVLLISGNHNISILTIQLSFIFLGYRSIASSTEVLSLLSTEADTGTLALEG